MKKFLYIIIIVLLAFQGAKAQQGFGTSKPDPAAVIDMTATDKGALLPRVALTSTTDVATVPNPANALTVFNTATAGTAPNNVLPGYYYWSSSTSTWIRLLAGNDPPFAWALKGNAGTDSATNFIGTTDAKPIRFKLDNVLSGMISPINSNVSFGYKALGSYTGVNDLPAELNNARGVANNLSQIANKSVAIGHMALGAATETYRNVAIGAFALGKGGGDSGSRLANSVGVGYRSMYHSGSTGKPSFGNTTVGAHTLVNNVSGSSNVAIGTWALTEMNNDGPGLSINRNIGIGYTTLQTGMSKFDDNIVIGNTRFDYNNIGLNSVEKSLILGSYVVENYPNSSLANRLLVGMRLNEAANVPTNFLLDGDFATKVLTINNTLKVSDLNTSATATAGNRMVVADPNGQLKIGLATLIPTSIVVVTADYTVSASDCTIIANATAAGFTITLPAASAHPGRQLVIRKADETNNTLTFSQNLKYSVSTNITTVNSLSTLQLQSDGTNWWVISKGL